MSYLYTVSLCIISLFQSFLYCTPRVSIITSVYDGDQFIEGFLYDITSQTIFDECELILVNAHSPGHEDEIIFRFLESYTNIIYITLDNDPGLYAVWNIAIKHAQAPLITNANLDDRRNPTCIEKQALWLETNSTIDLVYGNYRISTVPNEPYLSTHSLYPLVSPPEFSLAASYLCLAGPQPMWRKSLHEKYGFFNEKFHYAGDMEMWCRAISNGAQFKKLPLVTGVYYYNPNGLSTTKDPKKEALRNQENQAIYAQYSYLWKNKT